MPMHHSGEKSKQAEGAVHMDDGNYHSCNTSLQKFLLYFIWTMLESLNRLLDLTVATCFATLTLNPQQQEH